uniref:ATPase subunit 6 n=1 Tax=Uvitellina sp. SSS-2019 TaxID=2587434 RepID=A0A4Y5RCZ1_9TREM|nr:ATP synthase F0 subunit 6 [Uvitellina sp. SSS-2019]QCY72815.1 ATPase subunit 6 [Uvitellina sp. SSS-2019]
MFFSRFWVMCECITSFVGKNDCKILGDVYFFNLVLLLCCFLYLRIPYIYGFYGFGLVLVFFIAPLFLSLFFSRLSLFGFRSFFCGFIPLGTPLWISPFVCLAETLSYMVRPAVLMLRPFVNLTIGSLGGVALGSLVFKFGGGVVVFLLLLFFYEIFVALVHWFIVCNILSFSKDH